MDETEIEEIAKKIRDAFYGWPSNPAAVGLVYGPWETIPEHKRDMWRALAREATGGLTHDNPQSKAQAG